jgi:exonuclease III
MLGMRIATWNLNHRTLEKKITSEAIIGIRLLDANVLILTEFVDGPSRLPFMNSLKEMGYVSICISSRLPKHNQVLIASRTPQISGDLTPPDTTDHAETNFLHSVLPAHKIEVVGIRPPSYTGHELKDYWVQLGRTIVKTRERAILFMGDFNCDPFHSSTLGARTLKNLCSIGFTIPDPEGKWSYISHNGTQSSRIDHAVISSALGPCSASYVHRSGSVIFAGPKHENPVSDHAVLVLDILKSSC